MYTSVSIPLSIVLLKSPPNIPGWLESGSTPLLKTLNPAVQPPSIVNEKINNSSPVTRFVKAPLESTPWKSFCGWALGAYIIELSPQFPAL